MSNNGQGIDCYEKSLGKVDLENVRAKNNYPSDSSEGVGMKLVSSNINLKNVEASGNRNTGISMTASDDGSNGANGEIEVKIVGTTVVRNNGNHGILFKTGGLDSLSGNMDVHGQTFIYGNNGIGLFIAAGANINVGMKKGGSMYSCGNAGSDVRNNGEGSMATKGITCGRQSGDGELPGCTRAQCTAAVSECAAS